MNYRLEGDGAFDELKEINVDSLLVRSIGVLCDRGELTTPS